MIMTSSHGAKGILRASSPKDLISNLPVNVIDDIMKRIPLRDAARLFVLSRKWRHIWVSLPHLKFDAQLFKQVLKNKKFQAYEFYGIVSKVFLSHDGPISQVFLHIPNFSPTTSPEIGQLINFLSKNAVREITLENCGSSRVKLPSHLFICVELESLKLSYCTFSVPPTFKVFAKLIRLELEKMRFLGDTFGGFISSCPVLEILILKEFKGVDQLTIGASNLKYLEVCGKFESISLYGCQDLLSVTINLLESVENNHVTESRNLVEFLSCSCKVEELYLRGFFFKFLAGACFWDMSKRTFEHLKKLQISNIHSNCYFQFPYAIQTLQGCPNIEQLEISFMSSNDTWKRDIPSNACCSFCRLHSASIIDVKGLGLELKLIEFLLACSPVLKRLYVQHSMYITADTESKMSRELMRFPRASPKAEVIYDDP